MVESPVKRPLGLSFLLAAAVYLNCLGNGFTYDDFYYIVNNEQIRQAPWKLFAQTYLGTGLYRPLGMLSYAANYALGGLNPFGYHLFNILLHAGITVLFYLLVVELLDRPRAAFAAALLFAVHPIHTEPVASAVGSTELQATGFLMAAWLLHLRNRAWQHPGWRSRSAGPRLLLAAGCFFLALLSKESAVAFLALAPMGDYVKVQGPKSKVQSQRHRSSSDFGSWTLDLGLWMAYAAYACVLAVYLGLRWKVVGVFHLPMIDFLDNPLAELPILWRVLNALRVAWKYVGLQLFPAALSPDYSYNAIPVLRSWTALLPALLGAIAVVGAWWWSFRRHGGVFLAGGIYLAGFALTSNVLLPIGTIMAERLAYLPSAGLCLLAGLGWDWIAERRRTLAICGLAAVVSVLAARTMVRNRDWRNNYTLFSAAVEVVPGSAKVRQNLGAQYMERRELEKARVQLETAYRIHPDYPDLLGTMGLLYFWMGDRARAQQFMEDALARGGRDNPHYDELATNYGALLVDLRRYDAAVALLDQVIASAPKYTRAYSNRGVAHYYRQEWGAARADAKAALRLDPTNQQARSLLGRLP